MALDPSVAGKAIADYIIANRPADGTPVGTPKLEDMWTGIMTILFNHIHTNADIVLAGGELDIPGTGLTSPSGAVTGDATNAPGTLSGKIT